MIADSTPSESSGATRTLALLERFRAVRDLTRDLCEPLATEDFVIQTMPSVSPTKWHLAHTTWFFETFIALRHDPDYVAFDDRYAYLFNSYYNSLGRFHARDQRGLLSRPTVEEIWAYRSHVERALERLIETAKPSLIVTLEPLLEIGCHHEQQHQELLLTDIKHVLASNPLEPAYASASRPSSRTAPLELTWSEHQGGIHEIGHSGSSFAYDNEGPRHEVLLRPYRLADRLVTNADFLEFVSDDGYQRPELWLSQGWSTVQAEGWQAPLYWRRQSGDWKEMTLLGLRALEAAEPVCHLSYLEADAYARWKGARLPSEAEWEVAARAHPVEGNFVDRRTFHPVAAESNGPTQFFGDVWEWTSSPYVGYPGYRQAAGALGEYNGKFMLGQQVLRGGSCASSRDHLRITYRNFFEPQARWQFSGLRLAADS